MSGPPNAFRETLGGVSSERIHHAYAAEHGSRLRCAQNPNGERASTYFPASGISAVTRKLGLTPEAAQRKVEILAKARVVRFEPADVIAAIELHRLRQISFWDALIVHAARCAGAAVLYSEDLQARAVLGGVRVVNPFA